ncbi:MAG: aspartate-semialdehyde dehydrogenase [Bacteroidales bacterium]|nr:aspartate-semialdehyde dehydrogenase [Bacteroidales bacterium]
MKIAIIGITGMVGQAMLEVLKERNFPVSELILVASEKSVNKAIKFKSQNYKVVSIESAISKKPDIAIFSAGTFISLKYAELFAGKGAYVIDNSSAWRMDSTKKLIIPEINARVLTKEDKIIANPNCSTIQMLMVLAPLHKKYNIKRVIVSTYQSVTGTGVKAVKQLLNEEKNIVGEKAYPHQIYKNCLPHCDDFTKNDYTKEEMKLVNETHKILDKNIKLTATAVRVPVVGGHSESVNIEFKEDFDTAEIKTLLSNTKGVVVQDDTPNNIYPMPINSTGKNDVFVGRIRRDYSNPNSLNLWIVADNLRKGAATNAIQIAEYININFLKK